MSTRTQVILCFRYTEEEIDFLSKQANKMMRFLIRKENFNAQREDKHDISLSFS